MLKHLVSSKEPFFQSIKEKEKDNKEKKEHKRKSNKTRKQRKKGKKRKQEKKKKRKRNNNNDNEMKRQENIFREFYFEVGLSCMQDEIMWNYVGVLSTL